MTAGSIIVFSNGDRRMAANEEAISSLLRRVYRAMTEEITPASNVEEELSRVFFPVLVHSDAGRRWPRNLLSFFDRRLKTR